jgi:RHS repeat-associated protein
MREQKTDESIYRYSYQGQFAERDLETGRIFFELREYDPVIGRWTAIDPEGQHWSPYIGMGNDPINGVDPDGGLFGKLRAQIAAGLHGGEYGMDQDGNWYATWGTREGAGGGNYGTSGLRDVIDFGNGFANAVVTNHTLGIGREDLDNEAFQNGQFAGDITSAFMGVAEMALGETMAVGGGTVTVLSGGTLGVVGVPAAGLGVAITMEGAATTGVALGNIAVHFARNRNKDKSDYGKESAEHTSGARPSTLNKHQKGQSRKQKDRGGEKGDARRKRYK